MIKSGDVLEHPVTREKIVFRKTARDTGGELLQADMYLQPGAFVAAALVLVFLGYVFLIITAVFGIAAALGGGNTWIAVLGVAALLHLGGAAGLVFAAFKKVQAGAFQVTAEELTKDREWLTNFSRSR